MFRETALLGRALFGDEVLVPAFMFSQDHHPIFEHITLRPIDTDWVSTADSRNPAYLLEYPKCRTFVPLDGTWVRCTCGRYMLGRVKNMETFEWAML